MSRIFLISILCFASLIGGCYVDTTPQIVRRFGPNQQAEPTEIDYDGEYRLLPATIASEGALAPSGEAIATKNLSRGALLGFRRAQNGTAIAIAGTETISLEKSSHYVWQMRATAGQVDHVATGNVLTTIGSVAGVIAIVGLTILIAS